MSFFSSSEIDSLSNQQGEKQNIFISPHGRQPSGHSCAWCIRLKAICRQQRSSFSSRVKRNRQKGKGCTWYGCLTDLDIASIFATPIVPHITRLRVLTCLLRGLDFRVGPQQAAWTRLPSHFHPLRKIASQWKARSDSYTPGIGVEHNVDRTVLNLDTKHSLITGNWPTVVAPGCFSKLS